MTATVSVYAAQAPRSAAVHAVRIRVALHGVSVLHAHAVRVDEELEGITLRTVE